MDRTALIQCFMDTMRRVREDPVFSEAARRTQAGTVLYLAGYTAVLRPVKSQGFPVSVVEDTTFHCAGNLVDGTGRIAVLNFANAYRPGGGVLHGAMAQEECLCRSSSLYCALSLPYLAANYYNYNSKAVGDLGSDAVIYSPRVTVIKSDDDLPMPLDVPFEVDVLTCAAPYVNPDRKKPIPMETLRKAVTRRIRNIFEVAMANGVDDLVLGAFGCGAFNNPPDMVAECFRQLLADEDYAGHFRRVVFAIKADPARRANYDTFRQILNPRH